MELDLEKLNDSEHLLDLLIGVEAVLDSLDIYCYFGWYDGEVVEGPIVRRYWVTVSLLYPHDKMPDPRAALRLLKHGIQVEFDRMQRAPDPTEQPATLGQEKPEEDPPEWLVRLSIPRRLLDNTEETDLAVYDDEVNPDDVESAKDTGIDDESSIHTDEQLPDGQDQAPPPDEAMTPKQAPPS